ncbi:MAG: LamG domain-containing protein [Candidatus Omnitrophota bacterium]
MRFLLGCITVLIFVLCAFPAMAQTAIGGTETAGAACSGSGRVAFTNGKILICNGTIWVESLSIQTTGQSLFQVDDDAGSCTTAKLGRLRYDGTSTWEYCNGSNWLPFEQAGPAGCGPANGLVGHWTLDETSSPSVDSSGFGNNGTWVNSPTSTTGKLGNALDFSGDTGSTATNDRIDIGDPADGSLDFGSASFSYGLWVYLTSTAGSFDIPFWKGGGSAGSFGYGMFLGSGIWQSGLSDSDENLTATFSGSPILNQWVHLFVVVDRRALKHRLYVNGSLVVNAAIPANTFASLSGTNPAHIGANNVGGFPFLGKIDDVRVYDCAMTDAEVLALYNSYP